MASAFFVLLSLKYIAIQNFIKMINILFSHEAYL